MSLATLNIAQNSCDKFVSRDTVQGGNYPQHHHPFLPLPPSCPSPPRRFPPTRGIVANPPTPPPPPLQGGMDKDLSVHIVHNLWPVTRLLLVAKGFWIHADMHRCS